MGAVGIIGGVAGAVELGKSIYKTTKEIQAQEIALRMLSETEVVYAKNKDFLIRISEQYGLELMTTTNAYKNYFAAAKTSIEEGKLSFEQMQMIFEKVSKSASMLGLSVEQQEGAFLALSQMLSKGTVQSEELRGQLGERLPGAFEVMAKTLNVTTMELGDMLKKGEVMATDVLPKFAIAYEKAIGADQIERTESLAAAQNRASNKWTEFVDNLNSGQGVIAATGMMFFDWTSQVLDLVSAKDKLSDKLFDEQLELNTLISKITSLNEDNSERLKLIEDLKSNYPGFISFIKNEDYSNQNLRKTLSLVNAQYRERITLQLQVENLEKAQQDRDKAFRTEALLRLELQRKLNKINVKYNLGFENITDSTAPQIADQIQSAARKQLGALEQIEIEKLQSGIEAFSKTVGEKNKIVEEEITITKKVQEQTGQQTEAQRKQNQQQKEYNSELFKTITLAEKLGGKKTIDFDPFDIDSVKNFISSKQKASAGESDKDRKKREATERKAKREAEKAAKEADKLEKERIKKEKENYEAGIDLLIYKKNAEVEIFKAESVNEKNTQDERYNALISSQKAEEDALKLNYEKQLTLSRAFQKDRTAFTEDEKKYMLENKSILSDVTTLANAELLILEKYYAEQEKLRKQNKKDIESNIDFEISQLQKKQDSKLLGYQSEMSGEIGALSVGNNLTDVENYEKAVYEIKRKYMLKEIEDNIAFYKSILENENLTQEQKEKNTKILLGLQEDLREFNNQTHIDNLTKANEIEQRYIEMDENIKNALVDLTNAIFDNRIQRIDEDIERSDEQYERQIELYEGDAARQKAIREQQEREREKLEAKKRKEQHKQAVFNKAMAIADIGWSTAQAIIKAMADPGGYAGIALAIGAGIAGEVQTAAILATPIPKYKMGRKDGPEEIAIVGDGGVHEVVEHPDGSAYITPNRDTVVKLFEGDVVHSSIDKYRESQRVASLNGLQRSQNIMSAHLREKEYRSDEGLIKEIRELQRILKNKNMSTTVNVPKMDLGHELWRLKQIGGLK
ncbi:tape measure protein [Flavobacterium nitrogenifigens]|uniref:tape measure protein n=1 Tax=Flavobacterium nitrogenifigens TaxID=1617283 RepID=UPI00280AA509|nr:tape measure protein [Flavobacterium nitrogenifigens]